MKKQRIRAILIHLRFLLNDFEECLNVNFSGDLEKEIEYIENRLKDVKEIIRSKNV